ncbi:MULTISPECIES: P-loop NTPase fold protein [Klebsiella pneumoniae complex]|jgi:hypothetical protein|uniref:P-loop NTPase fold protein n=3 Tax=Klebsiella TaxID=570 RepID=UPI000A26B74E|nr:MULTISPECIES: P-loop NTPase fold protein [Klebsiella]EKI0111554.1 hypothetical protein [Klebsiella pneumoniae]EKV4433024.1 hypothetical protein [Klebsiella pneumoniae]EKV4509189.1 hypothetical protein [Klebsiella pneumoniae]EKW2003026.1 hypothetical protein [Klebsiella pneumoniae]EKW3242285.1 hypothetical protein [Klebsiella pneumoniae]
MPITKILDNFLISDDKVAVLKGEWGVGKTHFWKRYYSKKNKAKGIQQIAYAYVSLFGVNSINEIKKEIYQNTVPINEILYRETVYSKSEILAGKLLSSLPRLLKYNKITKLLFKYIGFDFNFYGIKSSDLSSSLEYSFVNRYLICFDDLERRGKSLDLKDFMGFIDNLARDKHCKLILIFNENNLKDNDEERLFNEYREKVVDVDIMYNPGVADNVKRVFHSNDQNFSHILSAASELQIKNIRILNKIKKILYTYDHLLNFSRKEVRREFVYRVILLAYVFYSGVKDVLYRDFFNRIQSRAMIDSYSKKDENSSAVKDFISKLHLEFVSAENLFDYDIDFFLKNGFIPFNSTVEDGIKSRNSDFDDIELNGKIEHIWSIFRDSFALNQDYVIQKLKELLDENLPRIPLGRIDNIFLLLDNLGVNCDNYANRYVDELVKNNKLISEYQRLANTFIEHRTLNELIKKVLMASKKKEFGLDELLTRLSNSNNYTSMHIETLNSYSEDDYFDWILICEDDVVHKIRNGLLKFDNHVSPLPMQEEITRKAMAAIRRVASTSELNMMRVERILKISVR